MAEPPSSPGIEKQLSEPAPHTSPRVTVDLHDDVVSSERSASTPLMPNYASPMRHHKRTPSQHRQVKETLDARVVFLNDETDGRTQHRINQYVIQDEIGRGSYGSVHLGTDQFGKEYAIKEFSKARLRRRAQSDMLRRGPHRAPRRSALGFSLKPLDNYAPLDEKPDALYLIREEVAIMKKLDHPNLVRLIEVLDDPEEDSLYMVMEMCKKGVVMKVGLDDTADPYSDETCRHWFRDLILGIEYLHSQGVIHRDIKPDNLLLSEDNVLKVVDFGVSQMFEKPDDMRTAKSAGSPAFLPPELCGKHGDVSGKAADIWSMGVSLYCLKFGGIPFNRDGMIQMYDAIKTEEPKIPEGQNPDLIDLFSKILEKDPEKRIKMPDLRVHPWVTNGGTDLLLSTAENCSHHVEPPNELELNHAFTRKMDHLLSVFKVLQKFKQIKARKQHEVLEEEGPTATPIIDTEHHSAQDQGEADEIESLLARRRRFLNPEDDEAKGHASDINDEEPLFLGIGTGARDDFAMDEATPNIVADSPTAVDFNVYDRAYENAVEERLRSTYPSNRPTIYLTRFVKEKEQLKKLGDIIEGTSILVPAANKLADLATRIGISDQSDSKEAKESSKEA